MNKIAPIISKRNSRPRILLVNRSFVVNKKGELLIIKRSANDKHDAGLWEVPGGKLDEGQDISHALEREIFEETGLLVTPILRTGYFESEIVADGAYKGMPYVVIVGISRVDGGKVKISEEHDDYAWVELKDINNYELSPVIKKAVIILQKDLRKISQVRKI